MRIGLAGLVLLAANPAMAQDVPADLTLMPPVPSDHAVPRTEWGDPDLRATYSLDMIQQGRIAFSRPDQFGDRFWLSDAEFAERGPMWTEQLQEILNETEALMRKVLDEIQSGAFANEWLAQAREGAPFLLEQRAANREPRVVMLHDTSCISCRCRTGTGRCGPPWALHASPA